MVKHILSYGGGLNSTAMLVQLVEKGRKPDLVLFSDTGDEEKHTYKSLKFWTKWMADHDVEFITVRSPLAKSLYGYCEKKKIVPSRMMRDCTSKFKVAPIRRYLRERFGKKEIFTMHIGIDYGEYHRCRDSDVKYITNSYPLVDSRCDREGCKQLLRERSLPVPKKSGCWFCPFNKKGGWLDMMENKPDLFNRTIALEDNTPTFPKVLLSNIPLRKIRYNVRVQPKLENWDTAEYPELQEDQKAVDVWERYKRELKRKLAKQAKELGLGQELLDEDLVEMPDDDVPDPTCDVSGSCFL